MAAAAKILKDGKPH